MKRVLSAILVISLFLAVFCINGFAVERGKCGENLTWEYIEVLGEMHIYGSGEMTDFSQGNAPWHSCAGKISSLYLTSSLTHIGAYAFEDFASLKQINLPASLVSIGKGAFMCSGLTNITLPYRIHTLEAATFCECDGLESVKFNTVTYPVEIKSDDEGETVSEYISVSEGLTAIGESAFEFCTALENITLPKTLKSIGNYAFGGCVSLSSVLFNCTSLGSIGDGAFSDCVSLEKIELPAGILKINAFTFYGSGLKNIDLPSTVTSVGEEAFAFCDYLKRIDVYAKDCAFYAGENTTPDKAKIRVPKTAAKAINYASKYAKAYIVLCNNRALNHSFVQTSVKSTTLSDGYIQNKCAKCNYIQKTVIKRIKGISLSKTNFVYNGKRQYPSASHIKVLDYNGKIIPSSEYSVSYSSKTSAIGAHNLSVTFKGSKYSGKLTKTYYIIPKGTAVKTVVAGKGTLKLNWVKQRTQTNGYHIRYSTNKHFTSGVKSALIKNNNVAAFTLKKLAGKKGYYMQIRTYKTVAKKNYYSPWSKAVGKVTK